MLEQCGRHAIVVLAVGWLCLSAGHAETTNEADTLNAEVVRLYEQAHYAEAMPLAKKVLAFREKALGSRHALVGESLNTIALLYAELGQYGEAEPLYQKSLIISTNALGPDHPDVARCLNNLAKLYVLQDRYPEAEPLMKRSVALLKKSLGPDHPDVAGPLNGLGQLYLRQGRVAEAEALYTHGLDIVKKHFGPDHPNVAEQLDSLSELYFHQGRYAEAEQSFKASLAILRNSLGPEHPAVVSKLGNLAMLYETQGRYREAEPIYKNSLATVEKALGSENPFVGSLLNSLAEMYRSEGRYREAEPLYKRSLEIREKVLGQNHTDVAQSLNNLGILYVVQGRFPEAGALLKRSLVINENTLGHSHHEVGRSLHSLASLYWDQGNYKEAEPLYVRSLAILENALGPDHKDVGESVFALATLHNSQGRDVEAEPLFKRSLSIWTKALGPDHPDVARALASLAEMSAARGRYREAESLFKRSLALSEKALGLENTAVAGTLNNLASMYQNQARYREAEPLLTRCLAIWHKTLSPDHPNIAKTLNNLAWIALDRKNWKEAADRWKASTAILVHRAMRFPGRNVRGAIYDEVNRRSWQFKGLIKATERLAPKGHAQRASLGAEMFETAQWAKTSDAAASLAQMAARNAPRDAALARSIRERQDLVEEWQTKDKLWVAARALPPDRRDMQAEKELYEQLTAVDKRLAEIDAQVSKQFPWYAELANPKAVSLDVAQAQLRDDEALVLFLDTGDTHRPLPEETFIWVVTKTEARWVRSKFGSKALQSHVAALRCGLEAEAWSKEGHVRCSKLLGIDPNFEVPSPLPFDLARAHALYKELFGEIEDLIDGKHLLLVPSGPLSTLPFQVLATDAPTLESDYGNAAWLIKRHAITVLPSVSNLVALRQIAGRSAAPKPLLGYGNPSLTGNPGCSPTIMPEQCPDEAVTSAEPQRRNGIVSTDLSSYLRNGRADVAEISKLCPLPDTAHELRCVARSLDASTSDIKLGTQMTEAAIKKAPLDRYRVIHFATHGLLAEDTASLGEGSGEPALVFTPPKAATPEDDGLLTTSEVASLKLDADWVVMSACNTAGGNAPDAQSLSGLARAFFYAGARALLVSHWPVNSYAATVLTSQTFAEMRKDRSLGRSEAFRRSMLTLMGDTERPWAAHPSVWAPFVVVGEGGV